MRILLTAVNAKYIHSNLAVYSLKAAARVNGCRVELAEFTINERVEEILREIYKRRPQVLFFSCYIWNLAHVEELVRECVKVMPETPIWLGGPEVSYDAEERLEAMPQLSGILTGEGEETFAKLTKYYINLEAKGSATPEKKDLMEIPNLVFRDGRGKICRSPQGQPLDLDRLPFPYESLDCFEHRIIYYESGRGCPFSCSYCLSSIEKQVRFRSLELVRRELQFFLDKKVSQVKFVDRTFNCRRSHAMEIWRYLLEHDNGVTNFHFEISADLLEQEELELLGRMRPGLVQLEIGVQSVNPETLCAIQRRMDLEKLKKNVRAIAVKGNIHQHLDLIAGLPYEDYKSFGRSFNEVFALEPEQLQLGFLKVLKGSGMYRRAGEYKIAYRSRPPYEVLYSNWLSFPEILQLKAIEEMVEIYYNSHQFHYTLKQLIPGFESPFAFFEKLAEFYENGGRNGRKHSRLQRYEHLLDFIRKYRPGEEAVYRRLLTVDLYLREQVKSRPSFAPDLRPYQEEIRKIQRQAGKEKHIEVWKEPGESPQYLIFDYENRDPLTKDARLTRRGTGAEAAGPAEAE